jgi:15-cis-phytoene synthase
MPNLTQDLIEQAARVDPDRTMATSFLGVQERKRVISLILFAHEIARARAAVSEAGLAAIRLQWWCDVVEQIYAGTVVRAQPIAIALSQTVQEAGLPRLYLDAMIDAHERELDATPFNTWTDIDAHLDATHGNLSRLCALACGTTTLSTALNEAARAAGVAWGLSRLIVTTPQWCTRRAIWLPVETHDSLDLEALYAGDVNKALATAIHTAQDRVRDATTQTNSALKQAKLGEAFPVLAHACLAGRYAKGFKPDPNRGWSIPRPPSLLERQVRLTLAVAAGKI